MREQEAAATGPGHSDSMALENSASMAMRPALPSLQRSDGTMEDGGSVQHHFRAGTTYCVQTVQWACGVPIGWGKCFDAEGVTQVMSILNRIFPERNPHNRPSFLFYDNACKLLSHVSRYEIYQNWIQSTRFLVDAWHYINHRTDDDLCRTWCNPAPADGSQPDLVIEQRTASGEVKTVRAFNTETAEQLNAWLSGFEGPMRQMTNYNFDFFMHVLLFIYKEKCDEHPSTAFPDEDNIDVLEDV